MNANEVKPGYTMISGRISGVKIKTLVRLVTGVIHNPDGSVTIWFIETRRKGAPISEFRAANPESITRPGDFQLDAYAQTWPEFRA